VLLALAWRGGWLRAKLRAQAAVLRELPAIRSRRASVQATRTASVREFAAGLSDALDSPNLAAAQAIPGAPAAQRAYWRLARRLTT
jgi:N-acetylglucosaminyl-diphospho-decaprenol L-rhamnosyltransferase